MKIVKNITVIEETVPDRDGRIKEGYRLLLEFAEKREVTMPTVPTDTQLDISPRSGCPAFST